MKKITVLTALFIMLATMPAFAQINKIVGKWYSIDEEGRRKSMVNIYKASDGTYEGAIVTLLTGDPKRLCVNCTGADKNKPIEGMTIIKKMKAEKEKLTGGTIMDPLDGKVYSCTISYDTKTGNLKVRGSLDGWGLIGRNQAWIKAEN
ncbi:MAG: DUF2147 domain-containing protein [Bacteroidales bacterium]